MPSFGISRKNTLKYYVEAEDRLRAKQTNQPTNKQTNTQTNKQTNKQNKTKQKNLF